jgi:hypothetical protein
MYAGVHEDRKIVKAFKNRIKKSRDIPKVLRLGVSLPMVYR